VPIESLENGLRKLNQWYKTTGQSAESLREELLIQADYFARLPDGPAKTAAAMERFGKSGADLIPILNKGRAGIAQLEAEARRLGVTVDNETAESVANANDEIDRLHLSIQGLANSMAGDLAPALSSVTRALTYLVTLFKEAGSIKWLADATKDIVRFSSLFFGQGAVAGLGGIKAFFDGLSEGKTISESFRNAIKAGQDALFKFAMAFEDSNKPLEKSKDTVVSFVAALNDLQRYSSILSSGINISKSIVQGDPTMSDAQKREELRRLNAEALKYLEIRQKLLDQNMPKNGYGSDEEGKQFGLSRTSEEQLKYLEDANKLREERARLLNERDGLGSNEKEMQRTNAKTDLKNYFSELGNMSAAVADNLKNVFSSSISAIGDGIAGLIQGTMTWGKALQQIGTTILSSVIGAIAQMIARLLVVKALSLFIPGGAILGVKMFAEGGVTPGSPTLSVVGERGPELVLPAHVTSMLSNSQRSAMVAGDFSSVPQTQGSYGKTQRIIIVSDDRKLKDLESDPAFENVVVRVSERNKWRFA
jgi:hypothetical protein